MKKILYIVSLFPILPTIALAQTLSAQGFIAGLLAFTNSVLIPFLLGFAFLFFVFNAFRFFVVNGGNEDGQKNAKNLAIYGVLAFVILIVFWGVVNLLVSSIGLNGKNTPTPDYLEKNGTDFTNTPTDSEPGGGASDGNDPIGDIIRDNQGSNDPIGDIIRQDEIDNDPCSNGANFNESGSPCGLY